MGDAIATLAPPLWLRHCDRFSRENMGRDPKGTENYTIEYTSFYVWGDVRFRFNRVRYDRGSSLSRSRCGFSFFRKYISMNILLPVWICISYRRATTSTRVPMNNFRLGRPRTRNNPRVRTRKITKYNASGRIVKSRASELSVPRRPVFWLLIDLIDKLFL